MSLSFNEWIDKMEGKEGKMGKTVSTISNFVEFLEREDRRIAENISKLLQLTQLDMKELTSSGCLLNDNSEFIYNEERNVYEGDIKIKRGKIQDLYLFLRFRYEQQLKNKIKILRKTRYIYFSRK